MESIENYYDTTLKLFETLKNKNEDNGAFYVENPWMRELVTNLNGLTVLDIGCGYGTFIKRALVEGVSKAIGIDISNKMISEAQKELGSNPVAELHVCPMENLDSLKIESDSLDLVTSYFAIMYCKDYTKLVRDVHKILKKNGRFIFIVQHPILTSGIDMGFVKNDQGEEVWPNV
ncbi:hypothetical protein DLAC_10931 [Tieghemostelium lacteum]|uniref:Methyltransferase type 11 domain-containing protein n=1 Tax=Tieghemostelium lacteum TaxID=361077 RepID=A0A151Z2Q9_TIELA|nr:hypothetical protein DLAC_10931 [Tieghemostelium lacteum]|eukprot:KYQ88243.1 hypothetical protein DLAC_10931 [Tieghemostelium lacteum]